MPGLVLWVLRPDVRRPEACRYRREELRGRHGRPRFRILQELHTSRPSYNPSADHNVATLFRQLQRIRPHHGVLIAAQSVKRNDEWILLTLAYLRGNKHGIGHLFVRVRENISALLNTGIDSS